MSRSLCINDFITGLRLQTARRSVTEEKEVIAVADGNSNDAIPVIITPEPIPDELWTVMANAMLDPALGKTATPLGNAVRIGVLARALKAAEKSGWRLTRIEPLH